SVYDMMERYPEAKAELGAAKPLLYTGMVLSTAGGLLIGFPVGSALAGGDFNTPVFLSGVGLATVGLVLSKLSDNRLVRSVKAYNAALPPGMGLDWNWTPDGGRMTLRLGL